MNAPLKSFVKKINFILLATWVATGAGFGLAPATARADLATINQQAKGKVKPPKLTIKSPANKSTLTNDSVQVAGVVKGDSTIAGVYYELNGAGPVLASTANGWSNWWANLTLVPGANTVLVFAQDTANNVSKTAKVVVNYRPAPDSLSGRSLAVSVGGAAAFTISFTNGTFSQTAADASFVDGVGNYTYKRINSTSGKLMVTYTAPPNAKSDTTTAYLQFTGGGSGVLTNADNSTSPFVISTATNSALASLDGAEFSLVSTNADSQRTLSFIAASTILDNGNLFNVANPLVISVSPAYAGNIGDRVSVLFDHFKATSVVTNIYLGTVIAATTNAPTNTVTVFFDSSSFVSQDKTYVPIAGSVLNVLTYYYTNSGAEDSTGTGTYTYAAYSPVGALLQLTQTNENSTYVLTFDASGGGGTYYQQINPAGGGSSSDAGTFGLVAPPQITANPHSLTITNGTDANFNVTASGSAPLIYQWLRNGFNLIDVGNISGSATPGLTLTSVTSNDAASYQVVVTNSFGSVTSTPAVLNVITN